MLRPPHRRSLCLYCLCFTLETHTSNSRARKLGLTSVWKIKIKISWPVVSWFYFFGVAGAFNDLMMRWLNGGADFNNRKANTREKAENIHIHGFTFVKHKTTSWGFNIVGSLNMYQHHPAWRRAAATARQFVNKYLCREEAFKFQVFHVGCLHTRLCVNIGSA